MTWQNTTARPGPCDRCIVRQKDRCSLIEEFLQTEIVYNDNLISLREQVQKPLDSSTLLTPAEHSKIFGEVKDLIYLSNRVISLLNEAIKMSIQQGDQHLEKVEIGRILFRVLPHYSCYVPFIIKQDTNLQVLAELESSSEDYRLLLWESDIVDISYIEKLFKKPLIRIQKLPGFVGQILEKTPLTHVDHKSLQNTQHKVNELLKNIKKYSSIQLKPRKKVAPPKPKRGLKNSGKAKSQDFGKTFTKPSPQKKRPRSLNPFDSDSESDSSFQEASEVLIVPIIQPIEINCDSLDRAYRDLELSIESLEQEIQAPKSKEAEVKKTNLTIIEEQDLTKTPEGPDQSFSNLHRLSPRISSCSGSRSTSPKSRSESSQWENRLFSPGIIERLPDNQVDNLEQAVSIASYQSDQESSTRLSIYNDEEKTPLPLQRSDYPHHQNTSVPSIEDELLFDERSFYESTDESESIDEFELQSKGSELELSDLESNRSSGVYKTVNGLELDSCHDDKTLTRVEI